MMKRLLLILMLFCSIVASAQMENEVDQFIQKQMLEQKITGVAIGIVVQGKLVRAKGYGMANLEQNIPVTENTVFKLASVSKQFIATAIMKLAQEGKISLSDTVGKYFYDAPATWNKITIRHLLNHTSGLERESPLFDAFKVQPDSVLIRAAFKDPLVFPTGAKWQYCNLGYFMLADIIRRVSGKSFPQYMRDEIFIKNGMMQTRTTTSEDLIRGRADGYVVKGGDTIMNATEYIALRPSGAFISTITDMIKWEMAIQENKVLSKDNWQKMWSDTVKLDAANPSSACYGYGWETSLYKNRQAAYHGGSLPGFRTVYYRFPNEKTAIIILTNSSHTNVMALAKGVADILYKN